MPGLIWLLSLMVQEVSRLMVKETSDDASTSSERLLAGLASTAGKPELELFCSRPGLC